MRKLITYLTALLVFILLGGCSLKFAPVMTEEKFEAVPLGMDINDLEAEYGMPFDRCVVDMETEEYRYIQKVEVSPGCTQQVDYVFKVELGKITDKKAHHHKGPISLRYE
jgi:hypothetical protein